MDVKVSAVGFVMFVNGVFPSRFCEWLIAVFGGGRWPKRQPVIPVWLTGWLLAVVGGGWLTFGADVTVSTASDAAFAAHLAGLKVPEGFTVVPQPPFVVIGDERPAVVRLRATNTVKWAVDKLKQDYFKRDPVEVIDIWLFKDRTSYANHTRQLFNDTPTTPFGYYSPEHRALIMNIATGGGTLVHEIVHPFMRANFPDCPAWFNEGLASLYEQSSEKGGHIHGKLNWRFKGLEQAIKAGKTILFERLTATSDAEFYGGVNSTNYNQYYAQARYLCYYLQEKGLLTKFYREFATNAKRDPTGLQTLKSVLGEEDMAVFKKKWEKFVLGLRQAEDW
jgi:hypothetical protein